MRRVAGLIVVSLSLGLGWAVRGHFGHEWGACWAGALGAAAVLLCARREDWARRMPVLVALGGIGWAVGGMMSYGRIVGYCRGTDFGNVAYGLAMLAVVGGLYGLVGGGLLGLGLESTERKRPEWAALLTQMVAGAVLFWGVLIYQFEWKMTPPRSELWAACLGASVAMVWFLQRNGFHRALRVAAYSGLGAGLGFALGNFLQTLGSASGWPLNWWNVMEFTLGLLGGLGMAYGVFTREWPEGAEPSKAANGLALAFLLFAVPATNLVQAFDLEELRGVAERLGVGDAAGFARAEVLGGWIAMAGFLVVCVALWQRWRRDGRRLAGRWLPSFLIGYGALYIVFSHLKKGVFAGGVGRQPEQIAYWVVLATIALVWLGWGSRGKAFGPVAETPETGRRWIVLLAGLMGLIALMALVSIHLHSGLPGAAERF